MSLFRCPLCAAPLKRDEHSYLCPVGHSFDIAAAGYTHLLPPNRKHSKAPGDDKEMVAARSAFLDKGYYLPLRQALEQLVRRLTEEISEPVLIDSGCGEGWYTAGLYQALAAEGKTPKIAGVDISKFALRKAAKRLREGEFAVASVYRLPVGNSCAHVLTNVFSPLAVDEFARVLRPGGHFLYVVPSARHLWQMKEALYASPYENPVKQEEYEGFAHIDTVPVRYTIALDDRADRMALFGMTPYAWKTPKDGIARLEALGHLETEIGFDIHVYRRN